VISAIGCAGYEIAAGRQMHGPQHIGQGWYLERLSECIFRRVRRGRRVAPLHEQAVHALGIAGT
jgi:hypothetical protein